MKHVWHAGEQSESLITLLNDESKLASAQMKETPDIWCVLSCHWDCVSCYVDCYMNCFGIDW